MVLDTLDVRAFRERWIATVLFAAFFSLLRQLGPVTGFLLSALAFCTCQGVMR